MNKIVEGAKEALSVARGEQPASRIRLNGQNYVPESEIIELRQRCERAEADRDEWKQCCEVEAGLRRESNTRADEMQERCAKAADRLTVKYGDNASRVAALEECAAAIRSLKSTKTGSAG